MVVIVAALKELLIQLLTCRVEQSLPNWITPFGWTEGEEPESRISETILLIVFSKNLSSDASSRQVDEIIVAEGGVVRSAIIFADRKRSMSGFIEAAVFASNRRNRSLFAN